MLNEDERRYLETARIGRLATVDSTGQPHAIPICFALDGTDLVTPVNEKPQQVDTDALRRSTNIRGNDRVAVIVDHYTEDWSTLGWVQLRGTATHITPDQPSHRDCIVKLRSKYDQYEDHHLESNPIIRITPQVIRSWGTLTPANGSSQA